MTRFSFTWSPPDRTGPLSIARLKEPNHCVYMDDKSFIEHIFKYIKVRTYIIFPEFDSKGRLHYHGTLTLNRTQFIRFMKWAQFKFKAIGYILLEPIKHELEWLCYCRKEAALTNEILSVDSGAIAPILTRPSPLRHRKQKSPLDDDPLGVITVSRSLLDFGF